MHPALVVAEGYKYNLVLAKTAARSSYGNGNTWLDGLAATLLFLREHAQRVVFISDAPDLEAIGP